MSVFTISLLFVLCPAQVGGTYDSFYSYAGLNSHDSFGAAVSGAGDVNADGIPDFIIGSPGYSAGGYIDAGAAAVFSGSDGSLLYRFAGQSVAMQFGELVCDAGDVNADGFDDFMIGAPRASSWRGKVFVYSGATGAILYQFSGTTVYQTFGADLAGLGDLNADGFDDFLITSSSANSSAVIYSGANGAVLYQYSGFSKGASAGDTDGDGVQDFLLSDLSDFNGVGFVNLYSGATGQVLHSFAGTSWYHYFGTGVAGIGDVTGDGFDDIIISDYYDEPAWGYTDSGWYVFSGLTGVELYRSGGPYGGIDGYVVTGVGDVNGDQIPDFLAGNPNALYWGTERDYVKLHSGADGSLLSRLQESEILGEVGPSVGSIGDLNGDGRNEFIIGSENAFVPYNGYTGTAVVVWFNNILTSSHATVSVATGGVVDLEFDFPQIAASYDYKLLFSASGTGPTTYGVEIPLTQDRWAVDSFMGIYPVTTYTNLQGTLDGAGDATASFSVPSGLSATLIGRTIWMAAIANPGGLLPEFSSVAVTLDFVP